MINETQWKDLLILINNPEYWPFLILNVQILTMLICIPFYLIRKKKNKEKEQKRREEIYKKSKEARKEREEREREEEQKRKEAQERRAEEIYKAEQERAKQEEIEKKIRLEELSRSYQPKYLMTLNEKAQYKKIKYWANNKRLIVFTKVRLLDLITPRNNKRNFQTLLWKIQAKHVDFVICDQDIRVKCIIEISDSSHKREDRAERDRFVNEVLTACGYRVLQTYNVTQEELNNICGYTQATTDKQNQD